MGFDALGLVPVVLRLAGAVESPVVEPERLRRAKVEKRQ